MGGDDDDFREASSDENIIVVLQRGAVNGGRIGLSCLCCME